MLTRMSVDLYRPEFAGQYLPGDDPEAADDDWLARLGEALDEARESDATLNLDHETWRSLLALALLFGWRPARTALDGDPEWPGGYCDNAGQRVSDGDARQLANALQLALALPEQAVLSRVLSEHARAPRQLAGTNDIGNADDILRSLALILSARGREEAQRLAEYCQRGFTIY
jgi:hypothetical protein